MVSDTFFPAARMAIVTTTALAHGTPFAEREGGLLGRLCLVDLG